MILRRIITVLLAIQVALLEAHFGLGHGAAPMVIVMVEGFDHLTAAQTTLKGWTNAPASVVAGRFDGQAARTNSAGATAATKTLPGTYTTLFVGFAWRSASTLSARNIMVLKAGATLTYRITTDASGHIAILNSSGTTIATGTTVLTTNVWYYIESKAVINGASGSCEVKLNGVSEIATTTGNFGSSGITAINYTSGGNGNNTDWDDIYVADSTGSAPNNTYLGDVRVETIYPNGAGAHTAWTPNGAANNWDCVDETPPDDDTTYVSDATPNDIDSYACIDIDGGATVYAVQVNLYARKDDAVTRQIAPLIRQSSTDYVGTTVTMASTYAFYSQLYDQDPTPAAWTAAHVNADEFGVKEIA
jgi:hypothetical protein